MQRVHKGECRFFDSTQGTVILVSLVCHRGSSECLLCGIGNALSSYLRYCLISIITAHFTLVAIFILIATLIMRCLMCSNVWLIGKSTSGFFLFLFV
jgi:hypothetical protein